MHIIFTFAFIFLPQRSRTLKTLRIFSTNHIPLYAENNYIMSFFTLIPSSLPNAKLQRVHQVLSIPCDLNVRLLDFFADRYRSFNEVAPVDWDIISTDQNSSYSCYNTICYVTSFPYLKKNGNLLKNDGKRYQNFR